MGIMESRSRVSCQPLRKAVTMDRTKVESRKHSIPDKTRFLDSLVPTWFLSPIF